MHYLDSVEKSLEHIHRGASDEFERDIAFNLLEHKSLSLANLDPSQQFELLSSRSEIIIPENDLRERLADSATSGNALKVKFGIDPTGADVHLGHAVPMIMLDRFQRMGHQVIFIVGDSTAKIGDPSGRNKDRLPLTNEQIAENMASYERQASRIVPLRDAEIRHNSEWLAGYDMGKLTMLLSRVSIAEVMQRDDFRTRTEQGNSPMVIEALYPIMMGIDSVETTPDIEIGGRDQLLNLHMCRKVMELSGVKTEIIMTTDILQGTNQQTQKMSKSLGNYIALDEEPSQVFGKIMSIPDNKMSMYFKTLTEITNKEWQLLSGKLAGGEINPVAIKRTLALSVTGLLHGKAAAIGAHDNFIKQFTTKSYGDLTDVPNLALSEDFRLVDSLASATGMSKSELMRLARGGGISIIDTEEKPSKIALEDLLNNSLVIRDQGALFLRIGKRRLFSVQSKS